ncbi:hypothetical protein HNP52_000344 [Sphingomonas kyeonggiensis]|uniref:Uncharacterized protein n=1 Tax=Sphingomonas kyeonggiensis TaxID=1268553 RepID=A0A7W7JXS3_9SPHN|nr:DUF6441 family protein [Sphingomonas kyeonggiensis]MBB4837293.1 hypothetical protein [Sphingomonas kyeonggiensis]
MRVTAGFGDLRLLADDIEGDVAGAATEAMRETTYKALLTLRRQVVSAGLGQRLANTWRDRVYPEQRRSMNPSGYIWSNAPDIIDAFGRGAQIVPLAGRRYLAIPSDNVPRRRGAKRMTPFEVENAFNQDLTFLRGKNGRVLAFVEAVRSRNRRGYRPGTKGRLAQGRQLDRILMFTLVPTIRMPKLLDIDDVAASWAANFEARFLFRLGAR